MKSVALFVAVFALATVIAADLVEFKHHEHPCVWTVEMEAKGLLTYMKIKLYFNDWYFRAQAKDYGGVIIGDMIYRPDVVYTDTETGMKMFRVFMYDGSSCTDNPLGFEGYTEDPLGYIFDLLSSEPDISFLKNVSYWTNKEEGYIHKGDKEKYTVYYNEINGMNKDTFALYVDKDNYVVAAVTNNNLPGERVEYTFKYGTKADMEDFAFEEKYIYNCTHNEIMTPPVPSKERCAASAATSVVALVVACLVSALLAIM